MMFDTIDHIQFLAKFISAGSRQIIFLLIKELRIHQAYRTFNSRNFVLFLVLVNFEQCRIRRLCLISLKRIDDFFVSTQEGSIDSLIDV